MSEPDRTRRLPGLGCLAVAEPAILEQWYRDFLPHTRLDLSASGVEPFTFGELRQLVGITGDELDAVLLEEGLTHGAPSLRRAIAETWGDGDPARVMVTNGSSEAIWLTLCTLLAPGDEVVVLDPAYYALASVPALLGADVHPWTLRRGDGFAIDLEEARRLVTDRTRMVVVNFPHNPTGALLGHAEHRELVEVVADAGAWFAWDSAFGELVYSDADRIDRPGLGYERTLQFGTLSKSYGLPGMRIGFCIAPEAVVQSTTGALDATTLFLSPLLELIAERVVRRSDMLVNRRRDRARENLDVLAAWVHDHAGAVAWTRPEAGVCALLRIENCDDTELLCRKLVLEHGVLLIPGKAFGAPDHVRIGFGGSRRTFAEGLVHLSHALARPGVAALA